MTREYCDDKLAAITTLSAGEVQGWYREVFIDRSRKPLDGEKAALLDRARVFGIILGGAA
jgi:hypothetical protein